MPLVPEVNAADHTLGDQDARYTLLEYGDYECPYCGEAFQSLKQVKAQLGSELRFVFRNFPLKTAHPHAEQAAWLAEGADSSGLFWIVHDLLYENQSRLATADLTRYGRAAGMSDSAIASCLGGSFSDRVNADLRSGIRSGVNGTPTFFINGHRHDGDYSARTLIASLRAASRRK